MKGIFQYSAPSMPEMKKQRLNAPLTRDDFADSPIAWILS